MHVIISKVLQHSAVNCKTAHTYLEKKEVAATIQVFLPQRFTDAFCFVMYAEVTIGRILEV